MNQRTNHRAANNLGEAPVIQEGKNLPVDRGGKQRERRQKEWPSFSVELSLKKIEHPDMTGEITKYWGWYHTLLGILWRSPTLGKMLYPSRPGVEAGMGRGAYFRKSQRLQEAEEKFLESTGDLKTAGGIREIWSPYKELSGTLD